MNDRELLERAAKAAGIEGDVRSCGEGELWLFHFGAHSPWNPLINDGDALRLAVDLGIDVMFAKDIHPMHAHKLVSAFTADNERFDELMHDKMRATRRAIVRAAAELCP